MNEEEIIKYTKNIINATYIEATNRDENGNITEQGLVNKNVIQGLLDLYNKEKEKNKELENADLTTVYMNGFYDGEKKWKDKIKEKIEVIQKRIKEETRTDFLITLKILENELQELLEERN